MHGIQEGEGDLLTDGSGVLEAADDAELEAALGVTHGELVDASQEVEDAVVVGADVQAAQALIVAALVEVRQTHRPRTRVSEDGHDGGGGVISAQDDEVLVMRHRDGVLPLPQVQQPPRPDLLRQHGGEGVGSLLEPWPRRVDPAGGGGQLLHQVFTHDQDHPAV